MTTAIPSTFSEPTQHVCFRCSRYTDKVFTWEGHTAFCGECMSSLLARAGY